jgi:hypothetical protein
LAIDAFLAVRRETVFFRADMEHDAKLLGHAMRTLIADTWSTSGEQTALRLIDEANDDERPGPDTLGLAGWHGW